MNDKQNQQYNKRHGAVYREFEAGDLVLAEVHHRNETLWKPGQIIERKGKVNYAVCLENGRLICSHTNQLKKRHSGSEAIPSSTSSSLPLLLLLEEFQLTPDATVAVQRENPVPAVDCEGGRNTGPEENHHPEAIPVASDSDDDSTPEFATPTADRPRPIVDRPIRNRHLPSWLAQYDLF